MKRAAQFFLLITGLIIVASSPFNKDLEGSWTGTYTERGAVLDVAFSFQVEGNTLTGALKNDEEDIPISDGKIIGNAFTFNISVGETLIPHEGRLLEDGSLLITIKRGNRVIEMKLTKEEAGN